MENYYKGKNVEEPLSKDKIPIPDLPTNFIWMQVNGGSKMRNLLTYAMKAYKEVGAIVWSGSGAAIGKAISCVEIMKRRHRQAHQITKICYRKVEEFWEPHDKEMDPLVVQREIPTIHILLSKDPLNTAETGYQAPGTFDAFWRSKEGTNSKSRTPDSSRKKVKSNLTPEEFAALGLRTGSGPKPNKSKQYSESKNQINLPDTPTKDDADDAMSP